MLETLSQIVRVTRISKEAYAPQTPPHDTFQVILTGEGGTPPELYVPAVPSRACGIVEAWENAGNIIPTITSLEDL